MTSEALSVKASGHCGFDGLRPTCSVAKAEQPPGCEHPCHSRVHGFRVTVNCLSSGVQTSSACLDTNTRWVGEQCLVDY